MALTGERHVLWMKMYKRLVAYKTKYNTAMIPAKYEDLDPELGYWVDMQRQRYSGETMTKEQA